MGGSGQSSQSSPTFQAFPGEFGNTDYSMSALLGSNALNTASNPVAPVTSRVMDMANTSPPIYNSSQSLAASANKVNDQVANMTFAPSNPDEQNLINTALDQTAARGAVSGLGAPTQEAFAASIAPTLESLRQQDISNLYTGESALQSGQAADWQAQNQDVANANMKIQDLLAATGLDIGAQGQTFQQLQALAEASMPQIAGGNKTTMEGSGFQICCFIFIEAYDGKLLDVVRRYRDEHVTVRSRRGYYRLADVIVPWMRQSRLFKGMVKALMTDPMVSYGRFYYGENRIGRIFKPIAQLWLKIFDLLGGDKPYVRKGGEVI